MPRLTWCFLSILLFAFPACACAQQGETTFTVVIDPGHGGKDPGAVGKTGKEKEINLAIAQKLGALIRKELGTVKVVYTRTTDVFIPLYKRAAIANELHADLFISLHCNASRNPAIRGTETYIMGLHRTQENLEIAKLENAAILLESDYKTTYDGFDPNSDESYIIFSLNQDMNLERSTNFAAGIQGELSGSAGRDDRGVRQAGFIVLYQTTMPSVLIETGYISNQTEEKYLLSAKGQEFIAAAIFKAFRKYVSGGSSEIPVTRKEDSSRQEAPVTVKEKKTSDEKPKDPGVQKQAVQPEKAVSGVRYRIQIAAESRDIGTGAPKFKPFRDVMMYRHGGMYKYTTGDFGDKNAALLYLEEVKSKGIRDAFVVIFRNGERIPQEEANRLLRK